MAEAGETTAICQSPSSARAEAEAKIKDAAQRAMPAGWTATFAPSFSKSIAKLDDKDVKAILDQTGDSFQSYMEEHKKTTVIDQHIELIDDLDGNAPVTLKLHVLVNLLNYGIHPDRPGVNGYLAWKVDCNVPYDKSKAFALHPFRQLEDASTFAGGIVANNQVTQLLVHHLADVKATSTQWQHAHHIEVIANLLACLESLGD